MEAWLTFPIRLVFVVLIAYFVYLVVERARFPLTSALQSTSADQATPEQPSSDNPRPVVPFLVALATFGTAVFLVESLAIRRFTRAHGKIESLGGSIRFDPPYDSMWACFFFSTATVDLSDTAINDQSLVDFAAIPKLKTLRLANTQIGGATLRSLVPCRSITGLDLSNSSICDNDLQHLRSIRGLHSLILEGTSITNSSIEHLISCKALKELQCQNTGISSEGHETLTHTLTELTLTTTPNAT